MNLFPLEKGPLSLRRTFELYLSCAQTFDSGPAFLITAVSEVGAYGFENPAEDADILEQSRAQRRPLPENIRRPRVRLLDFHPELPISDKAAIMAQGLAEEFP